VQDHAAVACREAYDAPITPATIRGGTVRPIESE